MAYRRAGEGRRMKRTIEVIGTFATEPMIEPLSFWLDLIDAEAIPEAGSFGQVFQILLGSPRPTVETRVVLIRWSDLWQAAGNGAAMSSTAMADELADALLAAADRADMAHLIAITPEAAPDGDNDAATRHLVTRLAETDRCRLIDDNEVRARYAVGDWADPTADRAGGVPYTDEYFAALAASVTRRIVGERATTRKVIVLDCDDTLWGGSCAELGAEGVSIEPHHQHLQRLMVAQAEQGRLICLASKNDEEDVKAVFETRRDMILGFEHIVAHRIDWEPKPDNLQAMATELELGLDSFVFVDDNPVECSQMEHAHPAVLILRLPAAGTDRFLDHCWALDRAFTTREDGRRVRMYRETAQRNRYRTRVPSLTEFIEGLDLRVEIRPAADQDLDRVAQLTHRVNQFSNQPIRHTRAEVASFRSEPGREVWVIDVRDRFGDYGTVGAVIARHREETLELESLLISCRALGRGVEHRLLAYLGEWAVERHCDLIRVPVQPTARNAPMRRFLDDTFADERRAEDLVVYRIGAGEAAAVRFEPQVDGEQRTLSGDDAAADGTTGTPWPDPAVLARIAIELTDAAAIRRAVAGGLRPRPALSVDFRPPRSELERTISETVARVLRLERVGRDDNFSALGAGSLHLVRVHSALAASVERTIDLTALFQYASAGELAAFLSGEAGASDLGDVEQRTDRRRDAMRRMRERMR